MEKELFTLLRLGLDNSIVEREDCDKIKQFTEEQWQKIISISFKQGVGGVVFDGFLKILDSGSISLNTKDLKKLKLQWGTNCIALEERNEEQISRMKELGNIWAESGCRMLLMKGQANALYYPNPLRRAVGDIDCFLFEDFDKGNKVAASFGAKVDTSWYKHSKISFKGEMFENHQFFITTRGGRRSRRLNQTLCELVDESSSFDNYPDSNVLLPPVMFNALFLTSHGFAHFLSEGMRLKQVVDWAMFLKYEQHNINWTELYNLCDEFKYTRYLHAMNDIAVRYLGVEVTNKNVIIKSPYSEKIKDSVLYDDDYVFSSGEGGWTNRLHLIRNMIRYRWKYHEIYQENILKQFYYYITGFLFHTEG